MKALQHFTKYFILLFAFVVIACDTTPGIIDPEGVGSTNNKENKNNDSQGLNLSAELTSATPQGYNVKKNLSYGPTTTQAYDLYTPIINDSSKKSVSLIMVHGGGWSLLDKSFLDNVVALFKRENLNITIFNINHRLPLSDDVNFQGIMDDFNMFFDHHQSLKSELNLGENVVLWGYSSGGHLALTYSYKYPKSYIKAVAAVAAPTDLTKESVNQGIKDDKNRNLTEEFIGVPYETNPQAYEEASPIFDIDAQSPKTVLFYGEQDNLIDKDEQGRRLYNKLVSNNIKTSFHTLPNAAHEMNGQMPKIVIETVRFLKEL